MKLQGQVNFSITTSQQLGDNMISRLQYRADGGYFRGLVGDEMNKHFNRQIGKS